MKKIDKIFIELIIIETIILLITFLFFRTILFYPNILVAPMTKTNPLIYLTLGFLILTIIAYLIIKFIRRFK